MSSVWGVSMMRDEQDVAYDVIRHLAHEGLDGVLVADNLSTDDTVAGLLDAATDTGLRMEIIVDDEVGYWQSSKMTRLAQRAADWGADWIIPFDADEVWCSSNGAPLATTLRNLNADIADAALVNHFATDRDSNDPCVFRRQLWR